jgi:AcrR family transcriptional regulator
VEVSKRTQYEVRKLKRGAPAKGEPTARERILATAMELFYREGARAVGVDTLVERSGVSKTSLYRTFASKDDLIAAVVTEQDRLFWRWWDKTIAQHPGDPHAQLTALFAAVARRIGHPNYRGCPFINLATEFPDHGHSGSKIACANKHEMRRRLGELCRDMGASDPDSLAASLALLLNGANVSGRMTGTVGLDADLVRAAKALVAVHTAVKTVI